MACLGKFEACDKSSQRWKVKHEADEDDRRVAVDMPLFPTFHLEILGCRSGC